MKVVVRLCLCCSLQLLMQLGRATGGNGNGHNKNRNNNNRSSSRQKQQHQDKKANDGEEGSTFEAAGGWGEEQQQQQQQQQTNNNNNNNGDGLTFTAQSYKQELVLSKRMMQITRNAGILSKYVMGSKHQDEDVNFDNVEYFESDDQLDAAAFARDPNGYCYVAFRGTTWNWSDWKQNLNIQNQQVCVSGGNDDNDNGEEETDNEEKTCCNVHSGFYGAYHASYEDKVEKILRNCAEQCENKDECVVLTGHSQGAAIAGIAALYLSDMEPYVITFGQPSGVDAPCDLVNSQRWYRWINTKASKTFTFGIVYDPVPFVNNFSADSFGHTILLSSEDETGVAYLGNNVEDLYIPPNVYGFQSHRLRSRGSDYPGYLDRIDALIEYGHFPIRTSGYTTGSLCSQDDECESRACEKDNMFAYKKCASFECRRSNQCDTGRCASGQCVPKAGSCEECLRHNDCESGLCSWNWRCSGNDGRMDNGCRCSHDVDCRSLRCEGAYFKAICEAKLGIGARCNENSDCESARCTWAFKCAKRQQRELDEILSPKAKANIKWGLVVIGASALVVAAIIAIVALTLRRFRERRSSEYERILAEQLSV